MSSSPEQPGPVLEGEIGILARRRIEAEIIAPIYEEMCARIGKEAAQEILGTAIRKAAFRAGRSFAGKTPGGTDLRSFQDLQPLWTQDDALEIEVEEATDTSFRYQVTRCRYAEMYREMGLGEIGHLLSCNRDFVFPEGYNDDISLDRPQTLMEGAPCCIFRYSYGPATGGS
ncbi:L-2-amino-thiazoline-4-carboxylic acid hydrolase [Mangrovicoccus sp. HB161399]|uniref:L-2-amino-thiazoline-4-carboxylic acid hydrolase n=1 Tax=Mangrovicoccus sp. HB161399 TaxID=2720392 RepID=UPI001552759B|nr:L-2-amino-thiazoline-4-carboxylic acid hydrolase [Mangrovicoccus sp. HB161399]